MEQLIPHVYGVDPIAGDGAQAFRALRIDMQGSYMMEVKICSTNSPYKQAIALKLRGEPSFRGTVSLNGLPLSANRKRLVHVVPVNPTQDNKFILDAVVENGRLMISPASDILGDYPGILDKIAAQTGKPLSSLPSDSFTSGFSAANMYGTGLITEVLSPNAIRCYCNDHIKDNDYDDMVFEIVFSVQSPISFEDAIATPLLDT